MSKVARLFGIAVVLFVCASVSGTTLIGTGTEMTGDSTRFWSVVKGYTSDDCSGTAHYDAGSGLAICQIPGIVSYAGWWGLGGCSLCNP